MKRDEVTVPRGVVQPEPFDDRALESLARKARALSAVPTARTLGEGEELLGGRFRIEARIGRGGMGSVYRAYDREQKRSVALKILNDISPAHITQLKAEFRALTDVTHPNLAQLHELFADGDRWFFTMELVEGTNLLKHLRGMLTIDPSTVRVRVDRSSMPASEPLDEAVALEGLRIAPLERVRDVLQQLVDGVCAIHAAGKLHRDLKPSNVMVDAHGRVVVLDFGLVIPQPEPESPLDPRAHRREIAGTPAYMAPEQAAGDPAERASDWYAVGCILYEVLTGRLPFEGTPDEILDAKCEVPPTPITTYARGVPTELCELCMALLQDEPSERPTAAQIRALLGGTMPRLSGVPKAPSLRLPEGPLVGRDAELARLRNAFDLAVSGQPATILVRGVSGSGKSRLIQEFLSRVAREPGTLVLQARCYEREAVPYKAFDTLADAIAAHLKALPSHQRVLVMPNDLATLAQVFPAFSALCPEQEPAPIAEAHELRFRAFGALKHLLARMATFAAVVLYVDDLQWGDVDGAELLFELLQPPGAPALLFLGSYRSNDQDQSAFLRHLAVMRERSGIVADEIELKPLSSSQSEELATEWLKDAVPPAEAAAIARDIAREAAGSPLFIVELLSYRRAHAIERTHPLAEAPSLSQVIEARLSDLSAGEQRVLEVVALAAQPLPQRLVLAAAELSSSDRVLDLLRSERLIRTHGVRTGDTVECAHDRIREILAARIPQPRTRAVHLALAETLEREGTSNAELIAGHYVEADQPARAAPFAVAAADGAAAAFAFDRAARLYALALELIPDGAATRRELLQKRGQALVNAGRGADAAEAFLEAASGAQPELALELQRRAAQQLLQAGHYARGQGLLRSVIRGVGLPYPESNAALVLGVLKRAITTRASKFRFTEQHGSALERELPLLSACWSAASSLWIVDPLRFAFYTLEFTQRSLRAGDPNAVAKARAFYGLTLVLNGPQEHAKALEHIYAARALACDDYSRAYVKLTEAGIHHQAYRQHEALAASDEAAEMLSTRCTGVSFELALARTYGLVALTALGDFPQLRSRIEPFDRAMAGRDHFAELQVATFNGVATLMEDGDMAAACDRMRAIMESVPAQARKDYITALIVVELYAGHPQIAWRRILELERELGQFGKNFKIYSTRIEYQLRRGQCAINLARAGTGGERRRALKDAEGAARRLQGGGSDVASAYAALLWAGIADTRGDVSATRTALRSADALFLSAEMPAYRAIVHRRLGELGDAEKARAARVFFEHHGVANPARLAAMYGLGA
jgi:serine/threonine protein kinase